MGIGKRQASLLATDEHEPGRTLTLVHRTCEAPKCFEPSPDREIERISSLRGRITDWHVNQQLQRTSCVASIHHELPPADGGLAFDHEGPHVHDEIPRRPDVSGLNSEEGGSGDVTLLHHANDPLSPTDRR